MKRLRKPIHPVVVSRAELEALWSAWRYFLRDDEAMDIDPLADAIHRLRRRLTESVGRLDDDSRNRQGA